MRILAKMTRKIGRAVGKAIIKHGDTADKVGIAVVGGAGALGLLMFATTSITKFPIQLMQVGGGAAAITLTGYIATEKAKNLF